MANLFTDASSVMTVISLATFVGILWWVYGVKRSDDFDAIARLPLLDDSDGLDGRDSLDNAAQRTEMHHV